jgi:hypothetical protein
VCESISHSNRSPWKVVETNRTSGAGPATTLGTKRWASQIFSLEPSREPPPRPRFAGGGKDNVASSVPDAVSHSRRHLSRALEQMMCSNSGTNERHCTSSVWARSQWRTLGVAVSNETTTTAPLLYPIAARVRAAATLRASSLAGWIERFPPERHTHRQSFPRLSTDTTASTSCSASGGRSRSRSSRGSRVVHANATTDAEWVCPF